MPGAAALLACCLLLSGCTDEAEPAAPVQRIDPAPPVDVPEIEPAAAYPPLPSGWRWETFGAVTVGVPDRFVPGGTGQELDQWCVGRSRTPVIGRPFGITTLVGCPAGSPREFDAAYTGSVVAFDLPLEGEEIDSPEDLRRGDRVTRAVGGVELVVQAPAALSRRVLATVSTVPDGGRDPYGCPVTDPAAEDPSVRPFGPGLSGLAPGQVTDLSVCTYALGGRRLVRADARLLTSAKLTGAEARRAVARLDEGPPGGGPNARGACSGAYGSQLTVLRIRGDFPMNDADERRVVLRYDGCRGNGIDDGQTVRRLTTAALRPFLVGAAGPTSVSRHLRDVLAPIVFD